MPGIIDEVVKARANVYAFARYCPTSEERKLIGILLIAVSIALIVFFAREVSAHITLTGHGIGSIATYDVPYPFHGPLVVLAGVGAVAAFLVALHLLGPGNKR